MQTKMKAVTSTPPVIDDFQQTVRISLHANGCQHHTIRHDQQCTQKEA
jgi:hypothetical protein